MKKTLFLMFALLMGVSGMKADELPASTWSIGSALPTDNWEAMGENTPAGVTSLGNYTAYYRTQEVTLTTAGLININFLYSSGNHRLDILGVDALNGNGEVVASDYHCGYTGTNKSLNDYLLNGLSAGTYTLRYIITSGASNSFGNISIRKFEVDVVASLPQLTTDVNNPKYYSIASYNRGGYLTSNGADQAMTHVAFAAGSAWYFTAANGNNSGTVLGGVIAHCSDGTQMTTSSSWQTAASGGTVYILPNGYNTYGFSISRTLPISSYNCCDASNTSTGVSNWWPRAENDWQGTTWVFKPTVPIDQTGYYYFKGMATDRHPYLYSDFVTKGSVATYHHDLPSGTPSNGHIWKVTNSGTTFTLSNGEGLTLTTTDGQYSSTNTPHPTLTLSAASAGPDYYFTEAINLTNWGNDERLVTWTSGGSGASDNRWTFELADVSAGVYDVVVQGNDDGYVTYSGQNAKNGGFFVAASIAEGDLTAYAIDGYTTSISISGRTITVSYNKQISYTLTDANGATYSWSALGAYGVAPAIEGCDGYSLSNEVWNEGSYSYTADITFPFAVSSNSSDNYTFLGQFNNKNGYSAPEFLWHAKTVNETPSIIIHSGDLPTTDDADQDKYLWSIIPAFSDGAFTFTIKNKSTDTYVNSTYTGNRHNVGDVTLSATATPMTYKAAGSTGTCNPINAWYLPSTEKYLSANSITNGENAVLGVWGTVHDGISTGFPTYGDLSSIYWRFNDIAAKIANAGQYGYPAASETNTAYLLWAKGAMARGQFDGTKENYNNLRTWYEGFLTTTEVVTPATGKFYRIKGYSNNYITSNTAGSSASMNGTASANNIVYYNESSNLIFLGSGYGMYSTNIVAPVGSALNSYTFSKGAQFGKLYVKSNASGVGTYCYDHTNNNGVDMLNRNGSPVTSGSYQTDWTVEEVTTLPITLNDGGDGYYATLFLPVDVTLTDAVAYVPTLNNNALVCDFDNGLTDVPANTAVILKGTGSSATATATVTSGLTPIDEKEKVLSGYTVTTAVTENTVCVFSKVGDNVGFYNYSGTKIPGFKAYLPKTALGLPSNGFIISFVDDPTAVDAVIVNGQILNGQYYDLQGRKVAAPQKGQLYIVNGKKVLY